MESAAWAGSPERRGFCKENMMAEDTLPPVLCPQCDAVMVLTTGHCVACAADMMHTPFYPLYEKKERAAWLAEQRKAVAKKEVLALPVAQRLLYRVATSTTPGRYMCVLEGKPGLWMPVASNDSVEANYAGRKRSFTRVPPTFESDLLNLLQPEVPDDGDAEA